MVRIEADVLEGLNECAHDEIERLLGPQVVFLPASRPDALAFDYSGALEDLLYLRSVVAVSLVHFFPVPRPKALLGHQYFQALLGMVAQARERWPEGRFASFRLGMAGDESSVVQRLKSEIAQHTGLRPEDEEADLLIRLRRSGDGWEALVRLSPRPLATRPWRVCNMPGAMNGSLASAMMQLTAPHPSDRVINLACGSGTLLIERLALQDAAEAIGCDLDAEALACARQNLDAARGYDFPEGQPFRLETWDAQATPLADACMDVICADLPFGQLIGSHDANVQLYPRIIAEASRIAAPGARLVLLTHEVRLLERAAEQLGSNWQLHHRLRVRSSGMTPAVFLWQRSS